MPLDDLKALIELLAGVKGTMALLVLMLAGSFFEVWVWGKVHRATIQKLERERDRWQTLALSTTSLAREAMMSQPPRGDAP